MSSLLFIVQLIFWSSFQFPAATSGFGIFSSSLCFLNSCQVTRNLSTLGFQRHFQTQGPRRWHIWESHLSCIFHVRPAILTLSLGDGVFVLKTHWWTEYEAFLYLFQVTNNTSHNLANFPFLNEHLLSTSNMRRHHTFPQRSNTVEKDDDWERSAVGGGQMKDRLSQSCKKYADEFQKEEWTYEAILVQLLGKISSLLAG